MWFGSERKVPLPAGVALNSPWLDITQSSPSWVENAKFDYLPSGKFDIGSINIPQCEVWPTIPPRSHIYVDDDHLVHPLATLVLNKSWEGSPPVYICTGWELLADEDKFMGSKLVRDGVTVVFEEFEAMPHCFAILLASLPGARRCYNGWAGFIKSAVENPTALESKAVTVKARSLEEVELDFASLSPVDDEEMRDRVLESVEAAQKSAMRRQGPML
jgi:acetyl esterase/lipase